MLIVRNLFGWLLLGVEFTGAATPAAHIAESPLSDCLLPGRQAARLNGWMLFVNVVSLDDMVALAQKLGGSIVRPKTAVPRTAWVTIVADPAKSIFGVWRADPDAFPSPEPG